MIIQLFSYESNLFERQNLTYFIFYSLCLYSKIKTVPKDESATLFFTNEGHLKGITLNTSSHKNKLLDLRVC